MTALLTDNFPLLTGAPNGIKKLRELILELAIRGKLVAQDPNDEPASEVLKRIAEEKAELLAEGVLKAKNLLAVVTKTDRPFELPTGWEWASVATLALLITDGTHHTPTYISSGVPFISVKDINGVTVSFNNCKYISQEEHEEINARCNPGRGDILLCRIGTLGRPTIVDTDLPFSLFVSVGLLKLPKKIDLSKYFHRVLSSPMMYSQYDQIKAGGSHTNKLNLGDIPRLLVPVPPLAEQHRIVAKVDELMALCDRLEAQQADAESAHTKLVQALLDSLKQAHDATDFAIRWQRLAKNFHFLFTTEVSIDALKQTLLQLAVTGKLVPQEPNDEPAEKLYERIQAEKRRLVMEGVLKKHKPMAEISDGDIQLTLPSTWKWVPLLEITTGMDSGWSPACLGNSSPSDDTWGVLKTTAVQIMSYLEHENKELPSHLEPRPEAETKAGDILFTRAGPMNRVGISCLVETTRPKLMISDKIIRFHPVELGAYGRFIALCLNAGETAKYLEQAKSGMAASQVNISQEKLRMAPIPLAPLAEQYRIVVKVDQLMTLCNQLKTSLIQARQLNEQLASTLVERALVDDGQPTPVTTDQEAARTLLAAEITQQLHGQRTFGQRKLQKVIYLAEHAAKLAAIQGRYLRNVAGPHDRHLMNQVEGELQNRQWYERIERETVGHAYRPLSQAGQHQRVYERVWSDAERSIIGRVIELMRSWDTDRCEMTVTLYAAWNDFILEGRLATDEAIVDEVMHRWNDAKLRFSRTEWLAVLADMKKHEILVPTGFGKRTTGGMLSLPGFE